MEDRKTTCRVCGTGTKDHDGCIARKLAALRAERESLETMREQLTAQPEQEGRDEDAT